MFIIISVYLFMLILIFWSYCGYLILLSAFSSRQSPEDGTQAFSSMGLKMAVIIPCYNEEDFVRQKIDNLKALTYDSDNLEVFFVDGASEDNTCAEITAAIADMANWQLIQSPLRGKINQVNCALSQLGEDVDIIVSTDMDAVLAADILIRMAAAFHADRRVAVVGADISPYNAIPLEEKYWYMQALLRLIESDVYTAAIVVAPCYAYRKNLIEKFPEDCVADDVYIAFKANTEGYLTKCIESAKGRETRTPGRFPDFVQHKYRKANAYLVEILRFLYLLPRMCGWWKIIYLTKFTKLVLMPWVLPFFLLVNISLLLNGGGALALFGISFLVIAYVLAVIMMDRCRKKYLVESSRKMTFSPLFIIVINLILMSVGLSYPFYTQDSCYRKLAENGKRNSSPEAPGHHPMEASD